jgi:hypothetical protein
MLATCRPSPVPYPICIGLVKRMTSITLVGVAVTFSALFSALAISYPNFAAGKSLRNETFHIPSLTFIAKAKSAKVRATTPLL